MKNQITTKSPKNRFFADITYRKPLSEIGSASSTGAMTIDEVKMQCVFYIDQAKALGVDSRVTIRENKKTYPEFEWVNIESYNVY